MKKISRFLTPYLALAFALIASAQSDDALKKILQQHPEADANKDGVLTVEEATAYGRSMRRNPKPGNVDNPVDTAGAKKAAPSFSNVSYGPDERNVLDLWLAKSDRPTPLLVFIHGGGFVNGSKAQADAGTIQACLDAGVSYMAINYRYRTTAAIQDILRDCARSIQFIRAHAAEYNIDPARVASYGGSAGAGSSLWLAFHPDLADPNNADPVLRQSSRLVAAAAMNTQASYDLTTWEGFLGKANPEWVRGAETTALYHFKSEDDLKTDAGKAVLADVDMLGLISADDPPVFLFNSMPDGPAANRRHYVHHPDHSRAVAKRCAAVGVPVTLFFALAEPEGEGDYRVALQQFLIDHLKAKPAARPPTATSAHSSSPLYGLSGIVQGLPDKPEAESAAVSLVDSISATRLLYSTDGPHLREALKARNAAGSKTPVIVYMGGFTTNGDDVSAIEHDFRRGVAMTPVARLANDITADATELVLKEPLDGELAVKASTADFSDTKDSAKFCFWLRLDDELVKVTTVDAATGRVTVVRGFSGTRTSAHHAGASAFSPVYVGNRNQLGAARHSNSWPGGPDYLRYAVDPRQPDAAKFKAGLVARVMDAGYDGAWFDTFQPVPYNLCDALGRKVAYFWDFSSGSIYDFESYLDAIKVYIRNIRTDVQAAKGKQPVLYANSATASYARGVKKLFNNASTHDLLDGYCFEDSYLKVQAEREKGKGTAVRAAFLPITGDKWLFNVTNHADAASSGLSGICMAGPAGYLAAYLNESQPHYGQLLRFSYASHLLTVTSSRTTSFGLPLLERDDGAVAWPAVLYAPLGEPVQPNTIPALKRENSPCYAREFDHGLVIVNPSTETAAALPIPAGYVDAVTKQPVSSVTLAAADAAILLRVEK